MVDLTVAFALPHPHRHGRPQSPARSAHERPAALHLHEPLAAGAALPRAHRRAVRLRLAVLGRAHAPGRGGDGHRRARSSTSAQASPVPGAGRSKIKPRETLTMLVVLGLIDVVMITQPAHHGDRRRLRDVRVADAPRGPSGPARVAVARERVGAEGQARHRDHRHLVDPPAEDVHQRAGVHREGAVLPDGDPHHVPALGARHRGGRPHHAAAAGRAVANRRSDAELPEASQ